MALQNRAVTQSRPIAGNGKVDEAERRELVQLDRNIDGLDA